MANELKQSGAQSATFYVPKNGISFGALAVTDWAALPAGQLKSLLNKAYKTTGETPVNDPVAFLNAYADVGGQTELLSYAYDSEIPANSTLVAIQPTWTLDENGYPVLTSTDGIAQAFVARIVTRYSASE